MKRIGLIAVSALCLTSAFAQTKEQLRKSLNVIYDQVGAATKKKDFVTLEALSKRYMTEDFTYTDGQKNVMDLAKFLETIKSESQGYASVSKCSYVVPVVTIDKNKASARVINQFDYVFIGSDKKKHRIEGSTQTADEWIKVKGQWKLQKMVTMNEHYMVDGQVPKKN